MALETQAMIPDTAGRLRTAVEDLQILVDDAPQHEQDSPEYSAAVKALESGSSALQRVD